MTEVRLNPMDAAWIMTETRATPNHVGGLLIFRLPEAAPRDFLRTMMTEFRTHRGFAPPWNRRLKVAFNLNPAPVWIEDQAIDLEYHVRHAALPWPGGERELGELVGRLHSTPIDLARPPWECTIIEGLDGGRFGLFVKMHHSLIDGVSGMKMLQRSMATDRAKSADMPPFWSTGSGADEGRRGGARALPTVAEAMASAGEALSAQVRSVPQLVAAFGKIVKRIGERGDGLMVPFDAPLSVLNGRVREKRRFATQKFSMVRLRALAKAGDCTLNDIVLAICAGALRRFLAERDALPAKTLTTGIPVSVRPADDTGTGNAISFIISTLATDIDDPLERLRAIRASVKHAKAHLQALPRQAMQQYTMLLMAPTIVTLLTGIGGRTRPMFNITISNVPGPEKPLYFRGAELLAIYPASIVTHGQALNITCQSYAGSMDFGFTGCHTSVPSLQRLAVYAAEAVHELEAALLPEKPPRARPAAKRKSAPAKPAVRTRKRQATA
jgi:diacylglycerol O-acyltransferase / wax synthase